MRNGLLGSAGLSLLGGAAVGAAIMYLLDPESGADRRERIADAVGEALAASGQRVTSAWDTVADKARNLADAIGDKAHAARDRAAGWAASAHDTVHSMTETARESAPDASGFWHRAKAWASHLGDRAADLADTARSSAGDVADATLFAARRAGGMARSVARHPMSHTRALWESSELDDESAFRAHRGPLIGAGVVGVTLVGVGLLYLLDPNDGAARRQRIYDTLHDAVRGTGDTARRFGQQLGTGLGRRRGGEASQTQFASSDQFMSPEISRSSTPESVATQGM